MLQITAICGINSNYGQLKSGVCDITRNGFICRRLTVDRVRKGTN